VEAIRKEADILALKSPLNGREIMDLLGIEAGPLVGEVKDYLLNEVIECRLTQDDKPTARSLILAKWPPAEPTSPPCGEDQGGGASSALSG
jgi:hypothetical protein